ncbi:hypothetical protein JTB14_028933 [Gonioctena quinquepunctata]|nr:hypothetical protein JTB14_028933 [Gonioctena quinquepunctata]
MTILDTGVRQRLLRHLDNCVAEVDVDLRQGNAPPPSVEERLQSPDSSTVAKEVNNNHTNRSLEVPNEDASSVKQKNYDGNYVLLLPEHYVQLASALGVNLRSQSDSDSNPSTSSCEKFDEVVESNELADMWRPW